MSAPSSSVPGGLPTPSYGSIPIARTPSTGSDDSNRIPDEEFDLLVSKAWPVEPMLVPESSENAMLRGPRRYSIASTSTRRPSGQGRPDRRPSTSSDLADVETALLPATTHTSTLSQAEDKDLDPDNPFLGGISVAQFHLILLIILGTNFIACFDGTIMASSHPVITSHFGASNSASWLSTSFLLTSTAFQPLAGRISDSVGRKQPFVLAMTIFLLATVWCALAGSMTSFILARAACGLGAGAMMTLGSIVMSDLVPIEIRGTYQSYVNVAFGLGSTLGAALGGAMADHLGWRWEFGVQVPPLLAALAVAVAVIPDDLGLYGRKRETLAEAMRAFDFLGSGLMAGSVTFLILGLNLGGNVLPWSHPLILASLALFAVGFPAFLYVESRADRPIMPLHLLRTAPSANLILGNCLCAVLTNAILFNIPLFFQGVLLTTATTSGLYLILPSLLASLTGTATGLLITRTRRLRWPLLLGSAGYLVGTIALAGMGRSWPAWAFLLALAPSSVGQGFQFPGAFLALLAVGEQRAQAVATSTLILWRSLGMVLGVAGSSLVVQNGLVWYLRAFVEVGPGGEAERDRVVELARSSVEAVRKLDPAVREQVVRSYDSALRLMFLCCCALAVVNVLVTWPVKVPRLGKRR